MQWLKGNGFTASRTFWSRSALDLLASLAVFTALVAVAFNVSKRSKTDSGRK